MKIKRGQKMEIFDVHGDEIGAVVANVTMCADCMSEMTSVCKNLYECPKCRMHYYDGK